MFGGFTSSRTKKNTKEEKPPSFLKLPKLSRNNYKPLGERGHFYFKNGCGPFSYNPGEKVEVIRNSQITVKAGMLPAAIQNEEFIRGGAGLARFTLQNTGNTEIEIITASSNSPSDEIKFFLLDADSNVLSAVPFKQDLGEGVVTLSNGVTVARIKPGAIFSSSNTAIPVPLNAPDKVFIKLRISGDTTRNS